MRIQHSELNGKSAFDYCRAAIGSGASPDENLEVYRGETLAYTIKDIKWGTAHQIIETDKRGLRIMKYHPMSEKSKERLRSGK